MAIGPHGEIFQNFEGVDNLNTGVAGVQKQMNDILDRIELRWRGWTTAGKQGQ